MLINIKDAQFERDGFEVLTQRLSPQLIARLNADIDRFIDHYDIEGEQQVFRTDHRDRGNTETFFRSASCVHGFLEAEAIDEQGELKVPRREALNKLGHALHDFLPAFQELANSEITRTAFTVGCLGEVSVDQSMVIFKPPHIGGDVRWHQDASYLLSSPSRVVGVWFALEDATRENGCLWMAPGKHRSPLREKYIVDWEKRKGELLVIDDTPWPDEGEAIPIEVEAGQVVVFHDHMPHRSFSNRSALSRRAVTLHGHDCSSEWLRENWLHREGISPFMI